ncbi:MAG: hypothetical protein Q8N59_03440 [bacterium]|nr:hypothetical protein [bacterium]
MLFAQDGHQTSEKIKNGLKAGSIDGAILCPRTHSSKKLVEIFKTYSKEFPGKKFILDPNFYVSLLLTEKIGQLDTYPFFHPRLRGTSFTVKNIQKYVKETIDYQLGIGFPDIISPGVIIPSFTSSWSQVALQLFAESSDYIKSKRVKNKLLLCLPVRETALREDEQLSEYLDALTTLDADGYYVFIERARQEAPQWSDSSTLAGLLYLVHALSKNDYRIIVGYVDIVGLLLRAVGATGIANGWWRTLKQFTDDKFIEKTGGHGPKAIYTSAALLNSIFIDSEMQTITEVGLNNEILSKTSFDSKLASDPINQSWSIEESILHHWEVIKAFDEKIDEQGGVNDKLGVIKQWINEAQGLYSKLQSSGIEFEPISGPSHLRVWKEAITLFEQGGI